MQTLPKGHHSGIIYVRTVEAPQTWIGLFNGVNVTEDGVWTWTGLWRDGEAIKLEAGMWITCYVNDFTPRNVLVLKVNRKTIKVVTEDGVEHKLEVDR